MPRTPNAPSRRRGFDFDAQIRVVETRIDALLDALVKDRAALVRLRARKEKRAPEVPATPGQTTVAHRAEKTQAPRPAKQKEPAPSPKPRRTTKAAPPEPARTPGTSRAAKASAPKPAPAPTKPRKTAKKKALPPVARAPAPPNKAPAKRRRRGPLSPREKEEDRKMRTLRRAQERLAALGVKPYKPKAPPRRSKEP